jgi:hypothetical protein
MGFFDKIKKKENDKLFRIKDKTFDITNAYLEAFVDNEENQLVFGLQIEAEDKEDLFGGNNLHFNSEILLKIEPNEIQKWQDIVGKTVEWEEYPEDEEEPHALFYVFEHEEVHNAKVEFKNSKGKVVVKISALVDIYADDDFSDNLPLEIEK